MAAKVTDPLRWLQHYTRTRDSHWREAGAEGPYRPFPGKPYFLPVIEAIQKEPVIFIEKSRDLMLSWLCVAFFAHAAMTTEGIEILLQSQKETKAFELVDYAKVLYEYQDPEIKLACPLSKPLKDQPAGALEFAHGSRLIGIPGGGEQIRSYHPWGYLGDEAAFMPEGGDAYDNALPVCQKIIVLSSAGPGWFADFVSGADREHEIIIPGLSRRRTRGGVSVVRVHYSADPERDQKWVKREKPKYTSQAKWDREQEIIHEAGGGERVFAEVFSKWQSRIVVSRPE